jgi:hypothetical protein
VVDVVVVGIYYESNMEVDRQEGRGRAATQEALPESTQLVTAVTMLDVTMMAGVLHASPSLGRSDGSNLEYAKIHLFIHSLKKLKHCM